MAREPVPSGGGSRPLSVREIARLWLDAGGWQYATVVACSVALAESGGSPDAVSPSDDYGLWQINEIHFAHFGVNADTVLDPAINARIAVSISGQGHNWAAWCTCWTDPARDCGHGYLPTPQPGSPAWREEPTVIGALGGAHNGAPNTPTGSSMSGVDAAWTYAQNFFSHTGPYLHNQIAALTHDIGGLAR